MPDFASELKQRLVALPGARPSDLEGASDDEVRDLETYAGGQLPTVYKQFLKQLGRSAGALFRGTDYSVSKRFQLHFREHAEVLLRRNKAPFNLPKTVFVFLMAQGYQFTFFHLDQGDDPAVYHYLEGDPAPRQLDGSLSGYLQRCVEQCEQMAR